MSNKNSHKTSDSTSESDAGNLHQIREILLGPLSESVERRLDEFERRLERSLADQRDELLARIDDVQQQARDELDKMKKDLAREREHRTTSTDEVRQTLEDQLRNEASGLRRELVDRASIAAALSDLAMQIAGSPVDILAAEESDAAIETLMGSGGAVSLPEGSSSDSKP